MPVQLRPRTREDDGSSREDDSEVAAGEVGPSQEERGIARGEERERGRGKERERKEKRERKTERERREKNFMRLQPMQDGDSVPRSVSA
jgi:hypothetical protein